MLRNCAGVDPSDVLTDERKRDFEADLVLPVDERPDVLPKACHMVAPDKEDELRLMLLERGLCCLVPSDDIPRGGSPLRSRHCG